MARKKPEDAKPEAWMPLYIGAYLSDTMALSNAERGAYLLVMLTAWVHGGRLHDDDEELRTIARLPDGADTRFLRGFFVVEGPSLVHPGLCDLFVKHMTRRPPPRRDVTEYRWMQLRVAVFMRDDYVCRYCGVRTDAPHCDHIVPVSRGGLSVMENLATACGPCNWSKNDKMLSEWPAT